jgi:hypothetical protein
MTGDQAIIRRSSGGAVIIEAPEGCYRLSSENIRDILFYGHRVSILRDNCGPDSEATIYGKRPGFNGARRIFFITPTRSFSIADLSFVSVVKGKWAAASMIADSQRMADNVA